MKKDDEVFTIQEEAPERKWYGMIPRLVDDLPLSISSHRLYCHYKTIIGENPTGKCTESTGTTSKTLRISKSTLSRARKELEDYGLVYVKKIPRKHGEWDGCVVTIRDIWNINNLFYENLYRVKQSGRKDIYDQSLALIRSGQTEPAMKLLVEVQPVL